MNTDSAPDPAKKDLLEALIPFVAQGGRLLEIGSGKGEYALYLAPHLKAVHWVMSEQKSKLAGLKRHVKKRPANLHGPERLSIGEDDFPGKKPFDYVFTAHTLERMSWKHNKTLFKLLGKRLRENALVCIYGHFKRAGEFQTEQQAALDAQLKAKEPRWGLRNLEDVTHAMEKSGFKCLKAESFFDGRQILIFCRQAHK